MTSRTLTTAVNGDFFVNLRRWGRGEGGTTDALAMTTVSPLAAERFNCNSVYFVGKTRLLSGNMVLTISIYIHSHLVSIRGF
jgi:hypothetical protein